MFAKTPKPPYYAVIFTSERSQEDVAGEQAYEKTAEEMLKLAAKQRGYLGVESVRGVDGVGITVSYWTDLEAIQDWKNQTNHRDAQEKGKTTWYSRYHVRVCRVERDYTKR